MSCLKTSVTQFSSYSQALCKKIEEEENLTKLVQLGMRLGFHIAAGLVEEKLHLLGKQQVALGECPLCGGRLESKGLLPRRMITLIGKLSWKRRVYRCHSRCPISQIVPSDDRLGIEPNQKTSWSVLRYACMMAVLLPYQLSSQLLFATTGVTLSPMTIWNWIQTLGKKAQEQLQEQLESMDSEELFEFIEQENNLLLIGSDGVMVPFRPNQGSPFGQTRYREVKIGVIAWLQEKVSRHGKRGWRVMKRRVVGVLGGPEDIEQRLWWVVLALVP